MCYCVWRCASLLQSVHLKSFSWSHYNYRCLLLVQLLWSRNQGQLGRLCGVQFLVFSPPFSHLLQHGQERHCAHVLRLSPPPGQWEGRETNYCCHGYHGNHGYCGNKSEILFIFFCSCRSWNYQVYQKTFQTSALWLDILNSFFYLFAVSSFCRFVFHVHYDLLLFHVPLLLQLARWLVRKVGQNKLHKFPHVPSC